MKKSLIFSFGLGMAVIFTAHAEESVLDSYIADIEEATSARVSARDILHHQPERLQIEVQKAEPVRKVKNVADDKRSVNDKNITIKEEIVAAPTEDGDVADVEQDRQDEAQKRYVQAPFDLFWGANYEDIKNLGWQMQKVTREGYENVFEVNHNEYPHNSFEMVAVVFGRNDKLWCIYAEGVPVDDTPQGSKILEVYGKYYDALAQKYGHAEVHFEPYTYNRQTTKMQNGRPIIVTETVQNPVGGDTFLQELKDGKARLFSTFYNNDVGVTLGIYVDENSKSRLVIEYKNLPLMDKELEVMQNSGQKMEGL